MPRPVHCRRVAHQPGSARFEPADVAAGPEVVLGLDELEALRLADLEGLYQEQAADEMGISRPTFGRIVASARRKVADALVNRKALRVAGGNVRMTTEREFVCAECAHRWAMPCGTGRPAECPACHAATFHRVHADGTVGCGGRQHGRGKGHGRGRRGNPAAESAVAS